MQIRTEKTGQKERCHCEQCGKTISVDEYQTYGCVCFDCWIEDETGFKD